MILDSADAWDVLGDDAERPSFLLRSNRPPEMHDAVRDDDIRFCRVRPFLLAQRGEQSLADQASLSSLALITPPLANTCSRSARLRCRRFCRHARSGFA